MVKLEEDNLLVVVKLEETGVDNLVVAKQGVAIKLEKVVGNQEVANLKVVGNLEGYKLVEIKSLKQDVLLLSDGCYIVDCYSVVGFSFSIVVNLYNIASKHVSNTVAVS